MKALTICQPYAHLVGVLLEKGVENRKWYTHYRGVLAIHAGKSKKWMEDEDYEIPDLAWGAVVAVGRMTDCIHIDAVHGSDIVLDNGDTLEEHEHTGGPYCWVMRDMHTLEHPYPCKGAQGLWNIEATMHRFNTDGEEVTKDEKRWAEGDRFGMEACA